MRNWKIILAVALASIILIVTPLAVLAQGQNTPDTSSRHFPKVHLAIVQPWAVSVGQEMQLSVFVRVNQEPAVEAGVWAITRDNIDTVKQSLKALNLRGVTRATEADYLEILNSNCIFLDNTDANGRIFHIFNEPANYVLVTYKPGYLPGYSVLAVREFLAIDAPRRAVPGDQVTITVNQKDSSEAVFGANVWMVESENIQTVKDKVAQIRKDNRGNLQNVDWESALENLATNIGPTDENGQVTNTFEQGRYLIVAVKNGCSPAYAGILITNPSSNTQASSGTNRNLN